MFSRFLAVTYSPKALFIHENADLRAILHVLALKTSKIKIGPCVSPLPFYVPSQLANLAACVDVLSRGRLVIGPDAGRNKDETEARRKFTTHGQEGLSHLRGIRLSKSPVQKVAVRVRSNPLYFLAQN